jgi:hypothetical protein
MSGVIDMFDTSHAVSVEASRGGEVYRCSQCALPSVLIAEFSSRIERRGRGRIRELVTPWVVSQCQAVGRKSHLLGGWPQEALASHDSAL